MVRFRNRYLLLRLAWRDGKRDEALNEVSLLQAVRDAVGAAYGDVGAGRSQSSLQVKHYSGFTGLAVLRCGREDQKLVLAALSRLSSIQHRSLSLTVLRASGSVRCAARSAADAHDGAVTAAGRLPAAREVSLAAARARLVALDL
ncbi:hypothetical protein FOA52_009509 [Chlamydomonas sp. UWO 241]|nr:hypothetical protein FOA52_009509 [Chlamydomonas sp. UWO 241]